VADEDGQTRTDSNVFLNRTFCDAISDANTGDCERTAAGTGPRRGGL